MILGPEHIMASGALPPGFPMIQIGTDYFWDGALISNTPLAHLLLNIDACSTLVFQVDLFSARGPDSAHDPGCRPATERDRLLQSHPAGGPIISSASLR